ncbi:unnamed protein product [Umbelopsis ramanniana]
MQTNELQRAQKQVTELQNTLSILENEYTDTMNNIVDMAVQKMKSVTEKDNEKADYALAELELYTSLVMNAVQEAGSMHQDLYTVLDKLESHEERLLEGLEYSVDKINHTMYQMAEKFATQLQETCNYSNLHPFSWMKSIIHRMEHGFTISVGN